MFRIWHTLALVVFWLIFVAVAGFAVVGLVTWLKSVW
jgi:hypothetical protein